MRAVTAQEPGRWAYEAYCATTHWRSAVTGEPLPPWDEQREDIRAAWRAAAEAVRAGVAAGEAGDGSSGVRF